MQRPKNHPSRLYLLCLVAALFQSSSTECWAQGDGLTVPATANIFGAGHAAPPAPAGGGAGVLPTLVSIPAGQTAVRFHGVTGIVQAGPVIPGNGPDGGTYYSTDINSWDGVSGILHGRSLFLVGVFCSNSAPADPAPPRMDATFTADFLESSPELDQVFFIGDGLGGYSGQAFQTFHVPAGATRLFLGFPDAFSFTGDPGMYGDNTGQLDIQSIEFFRPPSLSASQLMAGFVGFLNVSGATPGGGVAFVYSTSGSGPSNIGTPCGIATVELGLPVSLLDVEIADPAGSAVFQGNVPANAASVTVWFQALDLGTCLLTNGVSATIQ